MYKIAKVQPWVQPAPFKIDADELGLSEDELQDLANYCMEIENMYDYTDGDFTAVFDLTKPLFLEELFDGEYDDESEEKLYRDYVQTIKNVLPEDYKELKIGVHFCNG